jgi:hypothetical protein
MVVDPFPLLNEMLCFEVHMRVLVHVQCFSETSLTGYYWTVRGDTRTDRRMTGYDWTVS